MNSSRLITSILVSAACASTCLAQAEEQDAFQPEARAC